MARIPPRRHRGPRTVVPIVGMTIAAGLAAAPVAAADPVADAVARDGPPKAKIALPFPNSRDGGYVAKVLRTAAVRSRPRADAPIVGTAGDRTAYLGQGTRLLVISARYDVAGHPWIRVMLPIRPNGTSGWMRADAAFVRPTHWGIRVRLASRTLTVSHYGRTVRTVRSVVGAAATPTPQGLFAIYEVAPQRAKRGFTGPWALNLTGFSTVLESFGSGPGRVAIHGRDGASFLDPLGTARSHGCVRIDNGTVDWLQRTVTNGTPVRITAR